MSNPNANDSNALARAGQTDWLNDAPGGDVPFDKLFGTEPEASFSSATPTSTTTSTQTTATEAQQTTVPSFEEIRTSTGSVYKERDAVIKGIEEKDTLIQQLRDQIKASTGNDPLRRQEPVQTQPQSYLSNPTRFADDLASAAKSGDASKYQQTLLGLMDEYFGPAKPLIQDFARNRATEQTSVEYKDFATFRRSDDFGKVLERNPALGQAIRASEENIQYAHQLPELYRLAYESHTARKLPEYVQAARQTPATPVQNTRPTVQQTFLTPGTAVTQRSDAESLRTSEGRKELIARYREAVENLTF